MGKAFHSIQIVGEPNSIRKRVIVDGEEIPNVLSAIVIYKAEEILRVYLELCSTDIEIDEPNADILKYTNPEEYRKEYVSGKELNDNATKVE